LELLAEWESKKVKGVMYKLYKLDDNGKYLAVISELEGKQGRTVVYQRVAE